MHNNDLSIFGVQIIKGCDFYAEYGTVVNLWTVRYEGTCPTKAHWMQEPAMWGVAVEGETQPWFVPTLYQ